MHPVAVRYCCSLIDYVWLSLNCIHLKRENWSIWNQKTGWLVCSLIHSNICLLIHLSSTYRSHLRKNMESPKSPSRKYFEGNIYIRTPLVESIELRKYCAGRQVYLKMENCQPSGSFKLRGISNLCKYVRSFWLSKF